MLNTMLTKISMLSETVENVTSEEITGAVTEAMTEAATAVETVADEIGTTAETLAEAVTEMVTEAVTAVSSGGVNFGAFVDNLKYMGAGMVGIFLVIGAIILSIVLLGKLTDRKKNDHQE